MTDSTRAVTDSARVAQQWGQFKDYNPSTAPPRAHDPPGHNVQVAMVVLDMCLTIAPVVLLAAIWSKLNAICIHLERNDPAIDREVSAQISNALAEQADAKSLMEAAMKGKK